jgi:uncharacterized membrane protein YgcG
MGISRRLLLVTSLVALAIAGCGGGDDGDSTAAAPVETTEATALSKEELIDQGNGICAEVNAAVGTVGSTSAGTENQASQVAGLYSGMVERLKGLGAPSDDSAGYAEFIAAGEALAQAEENVELASEREDAEALSSAEAEASSALTPFQSAATSFGLEECAEAPAAPAPGGTPGGLAGEERAGGEEEAEEIVPEGEAEAAPEEAPPAEEESAGGGAGVGGGTEGGSAGSGGGSSGGIGPG